MTANGFDLLFDVSLEVDESSVRRMERGGEAVVGDTVLRLLGRENRIGLAKGETTRVAASAPGDPLSYYDVPLMCVVHSHPECRFRWSRLKIDLARTKEALIRDMSPKEVRGTTPVELKTSVSGQLNFSIVPQLLDASFGADRSSSRTVYYPQIVASGEGFHVGYWDFLALAEDYLHANRELRLLVSAPANVPLYARFDLRAKVTFEGTVGEIPLLRRQGGFDEVYRLD